MWIEDYIDIAGNIHHWYGTCTKYISSNHKNEAHPRLLKFQDPPKLNDVKYAKIYICENKSMWKLIQ